MIKKILFTAGALLVLAFIAACIFIGPYATAVKRFHANASKGYHADFYLYVSTGAKKIAEDGGTITILIQPNNSGTTSDDPTVHQKDAWMTGFERYKIADELN